jgi:hypothetical protein
VSVAEFVDGVDRLLTRGHGLFPARTAGELFGIAGEGAGSVPVQPAGDSGLGTGASVADSAYKQARSGLTSLDSESAQAVAEAGTIGGQGRGGSGAIRDQARAQAAAIGPMSNSASGMRLMVSTMDEHLAAMQRQIDTTTTQNQALATRLRQVATSYQGLTDLPGTPAEAQDSSPSAVPLESHTRTPGGKRHKPYIAGPDGKGPPNTPGAPPWVEIGPRSGNFIQSHELPGLKIQAPGELGPPAFYDEHGNLVPYIQLGPDTGAWAPKSDFPGAYLLPPGSAEHPPYGYEEYLPGSGIFMWHSDLLPELYNPNGPPPPPQTFPRGH